MFEKEEAKRADAKPKDGKAKATQRATKTPGIKSAARIAAGKPATPRRLPQNVQERIQRRAYELWESEGRPEGRQHAHWQQAEMEITRARTRVPA